MFRKSLPLAAAVLAGALALSACSGDDTSSNDSSSTVPDVEFDQELHDQLPESVKDAGTLSGVMIPFPPYVTTQEDGVTSEGASIDIAEAIGTILGVEVETEIVPAFSQAVTGLQSGRYDFGLGPYADNASTQENFDFVDWIQEFVVFAVSEGNPADIDGLASTCGASVAVLAGGSAETVLTEHSATCDEPVDIQSYEDGNSAILAVQSGRADAYFSSRASLVYFIEQTDGALELAGEGEDNGFSDLRQGSFLTKGSELTPVILAVFQRLQESGALTEIMTTWGLASNEVDEVGLNLSLAVG